MNRKLAGTGLAIGLVAGAGAGLILEMAGSAGASSGAVTAAQAVVGDSTTDSTAPTDATAPADPSAPDAAKPDPTARLQKILQPLIDDGTITQAQADKIIAALAAARPAGPMGGDRHRVLVGPGQFGLDVVATALGITTDEVRTALQSGQSLADLAVSKGKTAQDVIDAIVTEATTKINEKVTAGDLTQEQADKILSGLTTMATDFVNHTGPFNGPISGGRGFGPGRGFGGPRHRGDGDDDGTPAVAPTDTTVTTVAG